MKNLILGIGLLSIMGSVQANYSMLYPLEINRGGTLPNGTINVIEKPVIPPVVVVPPPPPQDCQSASNSRWMSGSNKFALMNIYWKGTLITENGNYTITTIDIGAYTYTRSTFIGDYGSYKTYAVCRVPK